MALPSILSLPFWDFHYACVECLSVVPQPTPALPVYFRSFSCSGHFFTCLHVGGLSSTVQLLLIPLTRPRKAFFLPVYAFSCLSSFGLFLRVSILVAKMTIWSRTLFPSHRSWLFHFIIIFYHLGVLLGILSPNQGPKLHPCSGSTRFLTGLQESPSYFRFLVRQSLPGPCQSLVLRLALSSFECLFLWSFHKPQIFSVRSHTSLFLLDLWRGAFCCSG